ncbi:MAG: Gfo/Idh/MocA family oxidoreductase [Methanomicrobia archaeon]|nr:Gfo/Idh/MocA family oxidoreductase [Methanomicrobia archaeon]
MQKLNVGIVGYDHVHVLRYVPAFLSTQTVRITKIAALGANKEVAKKDADSIGCSYYETLDKFFDGLDAIYVGTTPPDHKDVIELAAEAGVHVLCDKPIALTLSDADEIIRCAASAHVKLMVPFNPRFQIPFIRAKELIDGGDLGELQYIYAVKYGKSPRYIKGVDTAWFFDPERAGFGGFGDIGIHAIDALRWLTGSEAKRVYADIGKRLDAAIEIDDLGCMLITFANEVIALLSAGWANPPGYPKGLDVRFEILGTKGVALIEKPYHDFAISDNERREEQDWWRVDIQSAVDEFVASIIEDREPKITGKDGRAALEIQIAGYLSAETGKEVALPL